MLTIDARQMNKLVLALGHLKNGVPRALAPAINRALDSGRTVVKREIRKEYVIKASDIPVKVTRAHVSRLEGLITLRDSMLDLAKFKVAPRGLLQRKRVIRAQVKVTGGGPLPGAFNTRLPYPGPYIRKGKSRLPIKKLLAISAPIMASQPTVGPAVIKAMGDTLDKRIDHEIKRVMSQAGGKS